MSRTVLFGHNLYGSCITLEVCTEVSQTSVYVEPYEILRGGTTIIIGPMLATANVFIVSGFIHLE